MRWLAELERELAVAGLGARRRRRILAELADHLACDPASEERLGEPETLARQFADELGTLRVRRAALATFLALSPLGVLFVAVFAVAAVYTTNVASYLTLWLVLGVQLAFVGGTLALLRAWRLRRAVTVPRAEANVLLARAALGLAGGAITVAVLALLVSGHSLGVQWSLQELAWATVGVGAVSLLLAASVLFRAARLLPDADGEPQDLSFDLGVDADPWRLALLLAGGVAFCIALAGVVQGDPVDGLVRALGDGMLCLAGFAALGRLLGLRS